MYPPACPPCTSAGGMWIKENNNSELTVNRLEYPLGNILKFEEDSLINGSKIYVYLELDKDDDKTNKKFEDSPQSTDSTTIEWKN